MDLKYSIHIEFEIIYAYKVKYKTILVQDYYKCNNICIYIYKYNNIIIK